MSRIIGSVGATKVDSSFSSRDFDLDLGERHPEEALESMCTITVLFTKLLIK